MKKTSINHRTAVAAALLSTIASAWAVSPIAVTNAGFENPVLGDGVYQTGAPGWTSFNSGTIGIWNPAVTDYTTEAPEGFNTASLDSVAVVNVGDWGIVGTLDGHSNLCGACKPAKVVNRVRKHVN